MLTKNIIRLAVGVGFVLLANFVAMQFMDGVNWELGDFIVAGVLLFGAGLVYLLLTSKVVERRNRIIIGIVVALILVYIWAELAVGIFTNWGS